MSQKVVAKRKKFKSSLTS